MRALINGEGAVIVPAAGASRGKAAPSTAVPTGTLELAPGHEGTGQWKAKAQQGNGSTASAPLSGSRRATAGAPSSPFSDARQAPFPNGRKLVASFSGSVHAKKENNYPITRLTYRGSSNMASPTETVRGMCPPWSQWRPLYRGFAGVFSAGRAEINHRLTSPSPRPNSQVRAHRKKKSRPKPLRPGGIQLPCCKSYARSASCAVHEYLDS